MSEPVEIRAHFFIVLLCKLLSIVAFTHARLFNNPLSFS